MDIAQAVLELRGEKSQQQFATEIGISLRALSNYEGGRRLPRIEALTFLQRKAIADARLDLIPVFNDAVAHRLKGPLFETGQPSTGFASDILALRAALNLSQVDLAIELDVAPETVSGWERGRKPYSRNLCRVAKFAAANGQSHLFPIPYPVSANGVLRTAAVAGNEPCEPARHELSLRDQFAMAALTGITASRSTAAWVTRTPEFIATDAYKVADAMLRERDGKEVAA